MDNCLGKIVCRPFLLSLLLAFGRKGLPQFHGIFREKGCPILPTQADRNEERKR